MVMLSSKLVGIVLLGDYFEIHLNMEGKVIDLKLAFWNYWYVEEALYDIWHHDLIFRKSVNTWYVKEFINLFENLQFESTEKEKIEEQKW